MDQLVAQIILQLQQELDTAIAASQQAHASATDRENIAENKYDTLATEAAYLAHGQSMRIAELQQAILSYQHFKPASFNDSSPIAIGALVTIENQNSGELKHVYLGPAAGGLALIRDNNPVRLITKETPLAKALLGKRVDDELVLSISGEKQVFDIIQVS